MNFKTIKAFLFAVLALVAVDASAQDLIARQAPIDRRLKAVDSVALHRIIEAEAFERSVDIYKTWNTQSAHCYSAAEVPDSLQIDLRGFYMPTPSRKVTSKFGYRPRFRRMHKGIDVKVYTGDTIYAAFDGKIRVDSYEANGYGHYIVIRHDNGLETIYGHLSKRLVKSGDVVKAGMPIGLGGNTGRSFGSHLHFETRVAGVAINPALLFDFANQDVTADYYTFRNNKKSPALAYNTQSASASKLAQGTAKKSGGHYYKVRKGESLYTISRKVGTSINQLCALNRISKKTTLRVGQILKY